MMNGQLCLQWMSLNVTCIDLSIRYALDAAFVLLKDLKQSRALLKWNCKRFWTIFEVGETKFSCIWRR